jgi:hypothetical protein
MKTIETERKYKVEQIDRQKLINFCDSFCIVKSKKSYLTDYRFSIISNAFGGQDFQRLRIIKEIESGIETILWTQKYTDETGIRREIESEIDTQKANSLVLNTNGKILKKVRIDWHTDVSMDSIVLSDFSVSIDVLDSDTEYCYWEIEILSESAELEDVYFALFDYIAKQSGIKYDRENKSMLQMSVDFQCQNIESLTNHTSI